MIKLDKRLKDTLCDKISPYRPQIEKILHGNNPSEQESIFLIRNLLKNAFGYTDDEVNSEEPIYNKRADITVHYSLGNIICEGKRYNSKKSFLDKDAQRQLYTYCSLKKCEWGILTDGINWEFYWFPLKETEGKKIAEASFFPLPGRITQKWCEQFHIFHAKAKNRREYTKARNVISPENVIWWLRHKEGFDALCKVIQKQQGKKKSEIKGLVPLIYKCFKDVLPLEGRNNPYDPTKKKIKQKKTNNGVVSLVVEQEIGKK